MKLSLDFNGSSVWINTENPLEISIPLEFHGAQPRSFGVPAAVAEALDAGGFVGDTRRGGSCNVECVTFIPHCNGTHTECAGHITDERLFIVDALRNSFSTARLVSVAPVPAAGSMEHASVAFEQGDLLITRAALSKALEGVSGNHSALIIRTLPNNASKKSRDYSKEAPAFLSLEAAQFVAEKGFQHLLLDVPSLDRAHDEGKLSAHRIFWGMKEGEKKLPSREVLSKTITEFVFVPDAIRDGSYLLLIEIAPFVSDAAPSRVRLFELHQS
jgi:kynurenine formamidase